MQKMAVIDLDDTLLSPDKSISAANLQALWALRENGFEIIIGSGRHHANIIRFEDRIGQQGWVISSNGAVVRHARTSALCTNGRSRSLKPWTYVAMGSSAISPWLATTAMEPSLTRAPNGLCDTP